MDLNKIMPGHALDVLKTLPKSSINMCVTSPPYWGLRDYQTKAVKWNDGWIGELGTETNFNAYVNHLCDIFDEVKQVLRDDGTCWVNIGDTYKNKELLLIPFRFALEMVNRGWIIRNVIIWQKPNATPSSAKDRFTVDFEYLFFFSKSKKYYFKQQLQPIKSSTYTRCKSGCKINKSGNYKGLNKTNFERLQKRILDGTISGRNMRTVWQIATTPYHGAHFAVFPPKLIEIPIQAGCPENGIVIDPFIGSGTTATVCKKFNRNWIGIELNSSYIPQIEKRILTA